MPGPNIRNSKLEKKTAAASAQQVYYLTDSTCQEIHGLPVTDEMRERGLVLTQGEAMALVAAGAITTDKTHAASVAEQQDASYKAMREARDATANEAQAQAEASAAAARHNSGEKTLSEAEVSALMDKKPEPPQPAGQPAAPTAPAPAQVSAEQSPSSGWGAAQSGNAAGAGSPQP